MRQGFSVTGLTAFQAVTALCIQAAAMAKAAYRQAAQLAALGEPIVGLACTCALATDRPRQGDHKARACFPHR